MNESGGSGGRCGPDVAALADLDAGLPDPDRAARALATARADPDAAAVLDALAATRAELAALPTTEVPPAVAARWTAALAAEARHDHRSPRGDPPRGDRLVVTRGGSARASNRHPGPRGGPGAGRPAWRPLLAAAVLAAVVATGLGALVHRPDPGPTVTRVDLVALGRATVGATDVGDLADPARRTACLRAVAPAAVGETLLGGRHVVLDGRPGVLLVLATGAAGRLRIVTVDPGCGPEGGTLIAQLVVA